MLSPAAAEARRFSPSAPPPIAASSRSRPSYRDCSPLITAGARKRSFVLRLRRRRLLAKRLSASKPLVRNSRRVAASRTTMTFTRVIAEMVAASRGMRCRRHPNRCRRFTIGHLLIHSLRQVQRRNLKPRRLTIYTIFTTWMPLAPDLSLPEQESARHNGATDLGLSISFWPTRSFRRG